MEDGSNASAHTPLEPPRSGFGIQNGAQCSPASRETNIPPPVAAYTVTGSDGCAISWKPYPPGASAASALLGPVQLAPPSAEE